MKNTLALDDMFTLPGMPEILRAPDNRGLAENTSCWMATLRGPGDGTAGEGVAE
ncbi:MAG TPA: hypothetical protein VMS21_01980 [Methylomirabilota bacterium]|nr:hypothetical protein [Methylomirabilota bacterium]